VETAIAPTAVHEPAQVLNSRPGSDPAAPRSDRGAGRHIKGNDPITLRPPPAAPHSPPASVLMATLPLGVSISFGRRELGTSNPTTKVKTDHRYTRAGLKPRVTWAGSPDQCSSWVTGANPDPKSPRVGRSWRRKKKRKEADESSRMRCERPDVPAPIAATHLQRHRGRQQPRRPRCPPTQGRDHVRPPTPGAGGVCTQPSRNVAHLHATYTQRRRPTTPGGPPAPRLHADAAPKNAGHDRPNASRVQVFVLAASSGENGALRLGLT